MLWWRWGTACVCRGQVAGHQNDIYSQVSFDAFLVTLTRKYACDVFSRNYYLLYFFVSLFVDILAFCLLLAWRWLMLYTKLSSPALPATNRVGFAIQHSSLLTHIYVFVTSSFVSLCYHWPFCVQNRLTSSMTSLID
jgi:hypothetical protein